MEPIPYKILVVDDETSILSAVKRLLRPLGHDIHTALSGQQGLQVLAQTPIDLVISDMRMPEMNGAQFLAEVAKKWPNIMRILLTGYADLDSTVAAINEGHIYSYLPKPWEDDQFRLMVKRALHVRYLEKERQRLEALTKKQNKELTYLNTNLGKEVQARTEEIRQTAAFLETAYGELKKSYTAAIPIFANLIEMRGGKSSGHNRDVAEHAKLLGQALSLEEEAVQTIYFAALLRDIGEIGISESILKQPYNNLRTEQRREMEHHPIVAEALLMSLETLQPVAKIIRHHHERFDGKGFPDGLMGEAIPLGARILTIISDYDALQRGRLFKESMTAYEAKEFLLANAGQRYDPELVTFYVEILDQLTKAGKITEDISLDVDNLEPGMVLSRELVTADGILFLNKGHELSQQLIQQIRYLNENMKQRFLVYVHKSN